MKYYKILFSYLCVLAMSHTGFGQNKLPVKTPSKKKTAYLIKKEPTSIQVAPARILPIKPASVSRKRLSPTHELRGVWVSTIQRVDFPSKETTDPSVLKAEWMKMLKFYKSLNLNAVIVQVRPTADAIYPSKIVPYTKWLTGKSGKPLAGNFDLLKFMVETAHTAGLEFHAWINPYRVLVDSDTLNLAANHVFNMHRNWIIKYGKEHLLNPGIPEVRRHLSSVVEEIVVNYRIDAIHFDDYFYPYRIADEELPDGAAFKQYGKKFTNINDWRRSNNDSMIANVRYVIKKHKPYVQLGVSPFAVWRNKNAQNTEGSATTAFQTCYGDLYANVLLWMKKGWLDYVAPEVYFHKGHPYVDYETAVNWWIKNSYGTSVYISHGLYKINNQEKYTQWRDPNEMPRQLDIARSKPEVKGLLFFSTKSLMDNPLGVTDSIRNGFFYQAARFPK